jgi:hypothetical protein
MKQRVAIGALMLLPMVAAGCGSGHGLPLVPVSGQITFQGGPPPAQGSITFVQTGDSGIEGLPKRPGRAAFGTDGKYQATTFEEGDGLLPGTYEVNIMCLDPAAQSGQPFDDVSYVPADYRAEQIVVDKDSGSIEKNYDVPLNPKKKK